MRKWISQAFQHYFFVAAASRCLLPFLVLAFYSYPALDDFAFGEYLRSRSMATYAAEDYVTLSGR